MKSNLGLFDVADEAPSSKLQNILREKKNRKTLIATSTPCKASGKSPFLLGSPAGYGSDSLFSNSGPDVSSITTGSNHVGSQSLSETVIASSSQGTKNCPR